MDLDIALIAGCTLLFGSISGLVERSWVSGPLLFLLAGYAFGPHGLSIFSFSADIDVIKILAEITLAVVLFNDAASIGLKPLEKHPQVPTRTLLIALPMTLALGTGLALVIFPELTWVQAAILSTILAPTDAALGLAVIKNPVVPKEIRRGLNAESGLNDGICVPFLLVFLALAGTYTGEQSIGHFAVTTLLEEIGIGALVGVGVSATGLGLCLYAIKRRWMTERWLEILTASIAIFAFGLAQYFEGSGFIAAFCGGLLFGDHLEGAYNNEMEASEINGEVISLMTWLLFGSLIFNTVKDTTWHQVAYALMSLTVIRMLPVFISLTATSTTWREKLFIGWFGPRGLASIVFVIMLMQSGIEDSELIVNTASLTIIFSVFLHGITAFPFSNALTKDRA